MNIYIITIIYSFITAIVEFIVGVCNNCIPITCIGVTHIAIGIFFIIIKLQNDLEEQEDELSEMMFGKNINDTKRRH